MEKSGKKEIYDVSKEKAERAKTQLKKTFVIKFKVF